MGNFDFSQIAVFLVGIYCVYRGISILFTGKLSEREEVRLRDFSANGVRKYKMFSAIMNIVGGAVVLATVALRFLMPDGGMIYRIILLVVVVIMVVAYTLIWKSCKNAK